MGYDSLACLIAALCFSVTAWLSIAVRAYVRIHLLGGPFLDDILAFIGTIIHTAVTILFIINAWNHFSAGEHGLSPEKQIEGVKLSFIADMLYMLGTFIMKLSFARTLSRIIQTRSQSIIIYIVIVAGAIITLAAIIQSFIYCQPLNFLWEQVSELGSSGHCHAAWTRVTVSFVHASWILITDITLGLIIPYILLWGCSMGLGTRVSVHVLLGLGSIAGIATIIRMPYIAIGLGAKPKLNNPAPLFWAITELAVNIICTAAATWKPLFQRRRRSELVVLESRKPPMTGDIPRDVPRDSEEGLFNSSALVNQ